MSWKKYFKVANTGGQMSPLSGSGDTGLPGYGRQDGRDPITNHADMVSDQLSRRPH